MRFYLLILLLFTVLSASIYSCSDMDDSSRSTFEAIYPLAQYSVEQYVQNLCLCYGSLMGYTDAQICESQIQRNFPFDHCTYQVLEKDPEGSYAYLDCLKKRSGHAAACLVDCNHALVLQCKTSFEALDHFDPREEQGCQTELSAELRQALFECTQERLSLR